jgi:Na+/phosphate symporter
VVIGYEQRDHSWFVFDQRQLDLVVREKRSTLTHEPSRVTTEVMKALFPRSITTIADAVYQGSVQYGSKAKSWKHFVLMTTDGWEHAKALGQLTVDPLDPLPSISGRKDASQIITIMARAEHLRQMREDRAERKSRLAVG